MTVWLSSAVSLVHVETIIEIDTKLIPMSNKGA